MLNEAQTNELISGGDCELHHHSSDRIPTNNTVQWLASVETVREVSATGSLHADDDFVLGDTTGGTITLTLPYARNGKKITITKKVAANTLTIVAPSGYTVLSAASTNITAAWGVLRLKLFNDAWISI